MTRLLITCLSTILLCSPAFAAEEKYASKDGKYTATFPDKPKEYSTPGDPTKGKYAFFTTSLEVTPDIAFMVMYHDYPKGYLKSDPGLTLEQVRDGTRGSTGRIVEDREINIGADKVPGRSFVMNFGESFYRARIYLKGDRLYQVIATGKTKDDVMSKKADMFFDSFAITP